MFGFWSFSLMCLVLLLSCFSVSRANFLSILIFIELINVLLLLSIFSEGLITGSFVSFLAFIVVATMEVVISLVSLTRLWSLGVFVY
nr:NADH dehydrogenase subunit 4L [Cichlidogyrus casuarinus]